MIAILKYNAGNIASVKNALFRLGAESLVTDDPEEIRSADKVIFPGVGSAGPAMAYLKERKLDVLIKDLKQPVLGVCLGMQLMCKYSEEGNTDCLGIFDNQVREFSGTGLIPHMGWNEVHSLSGELFKGVPPRSDLYFVHSYFADLGIHTTAVCDYIQPFSAALQKGNFFASQFHPEKSSAIGRRLLENFLEQ